MDLMLHTGMDKFDGLSRVEYYSKQEKKSPYDFGFGVSVDDPTPSAHIYNLSEVTQTLIHVAYDRGYEQAPSMIELIQKEAKLEDNYEINMLLGDCYRQIGEFDKALRTYKVLWNKNGQRDSSIQDAIVFTKFIMKNGEAVRGKQMDDWIDDYHGFKRQETIRRTSPKISRNAPCPCGSGKKYKFCCGR